MPSRMVSWSSMIRTRAIFVVSVEHSWQDGSMSPIREQLAALLDAYLPEDEKEREDLATMRRFLGELAEPFSAEQAVAHFTASAVVLDPEGTRVCLVHHRKLGRWLQPGGHV